MATSTLQGAVSDLALALFQKRNWNSPMHMPGQNHGTGGLVGPLKLLLMAFAIRDPAPPNQQAAVTPNLFKEILQSTQGMGEVAEHSQPNNRSILLGNESLQIQSHPCPRTQKKLTLEHITFRSHTKRRDQPWSLRLPSIYQICDYLFCQSKEWPQDGTRYTRNDWT